MSYHDARVAFCSQGFLESPIPCREQQPELCHPRLTMQDRKLANSTLTLGSVNLMLTTENHVRFDNRKVQDILGAGFLSDTSPL